MKIVYSPYQAGNKYIENMIQILKKTFNINKIYSFKEGMSIKSFFSINYIFLNWYENLNNKTKVSFYSDFFKKTIILIFLFLFRKKIVFVFHNKISHDTRNKKVSLFLMKIIIRSSYKVIIHCSETKELLKIYFDNYYKVIEKKIIYIHHPNYIENYKDTKIKNHNITSKNIRFLFFGSVMPYKNLELLIEIFNTKEKEAIELKIIGKPITNTYKNNLIKLIKNKKIEYDFRFIPDDEINQNIEKSDVIILPYNIESSLNSGSVILAFSKKKTVISPNIGTIKDILAKDSIYTYEYSTQEEHILKLEKQIEKVIDDSFENKLSLSVKGKKLYDEIKKDYSIDKIVKELKNKL